MRRNRPKPEEIIAKLRQVDVLVSNGESVADAVSSIGTIEVNYYMWRKAYGGLLTAQVKRLKEPKTNTERQPPVLSPGLN